MLQNGEYIAELEIFIQEHLQYLNSSTDFCDQVKWEYLKYEIRAFTINFSKRLSKTKKVEQIKLENEIKNLEQNLNSPEKLQQYDSCKVRLEEIYENIAEGIKVRSRCQWYEDGEKSTKFFLNLEKSRAEKSTIKKLEIDKKEIVDQSLIIGELKSFYQNLFKKSTDNTKDQLKDFLDKVNVRQLNQEQQNICENDITEFELKNALKTLNNSKTPGNDELTKEFYETFWDDLKLLFKKVIDQIKISKKLLTSKRQAVIKLIEKKDRDKRFIKNWRPISLLNIDYKIISKLFATRLKDVLPSLISSEQTAYVAKRFIGEGGRLISDILEMSDKLNIKGYLVTFDIEKAFDSLDHDFIIATLKKFGFKSNFINWIKIFLNDQESCVLNGGVTTKYFKLERGACQGDSISAYLFILALEILFILIKNNENIQGIGIFE